MKKCAVGIWVILFLTLSACETRGEIPAGIYELPIELEGSLQNPAWSPDGKQVVFTRFRNGYNQGPADIFLYDLGTNETMELVNNEEDNVNLPGSIWNAETSQIVFSSTLSGHDEIYAMNPDFPKLEQKQLTNRQTDMAYEPSFSPDGMWVVFESHRIDAGNDGIIMKVRLDGQSDYLPLTSSDSDCRQPNWSPDGNHILFQKYEHQQWDIWIMDTDGGNQRRLSNGMGDKTDASFSADGEWIVFSADHPQIKFSELFIQSIYGSQAIPITDYGKYAGAPSWSPDGKKIIFEVSASDPEKSDGTKLWILDSLP